MDKIYKIEILKLTDENLKLDALPLCNESIIFNDSNEYEKTLSWLQQNNNNLYIRASTESFSNFNDAKELLAEFLK